MARPQCDTPLVKSTDHILQQMTPPFSDNLDTSDNPIPQNLPIACQSHLPHIETTVQRQDSPKFVNFSRR
jgi:hypothetical protein